MKKIILLFIIIVSINYNLKAQIALTGNITTAGVAVYPTHIDSLGKGGLMTLPDLTTRNALPVKRRKQGMLVYVQANDSLYKLTTADVSLNTGWVAMGILTQQKLTDSLNSRLKVTDTLSLSARIDLKANAGSITDVTTLLADKLNIIDTSLLLQKSDTSSLSNRIDLKSNTTDFSTLTNTVGTKLKITDTSFLLQKADTATLSNRIDLKVNITDFNILTTTVGTKYKTADTAYLLQKADTITLSNRINLKLDANKTGIANGVASLNALGKIPTDQIPAISFSSVKIITSEAQMLGLTSAVVGSVAVRTDVNKSYILSADDPTILANWVMLLTPAPPVQSVNSYSGNIILTKADLGLGSVDDYSAENLPLSLTSRNALALKLKITDTAYLLQKADTATLSNRINLKANTTNLNSLTTTVATKFKITDTAYLLQKADTASLSNRIISNVASITAETTRATAAETVLTNKITSNTVSLTANLNSINTLNTNVASNTVSISTNLTTLNSKITSNTASITNNTADILLRANIASPSFTGTPTAITAPALTNTTQLATTAFVRTAVTSITGLTNTNLSGTAGITDANLANITTAGKVSNSATSATATNTSYTIVARDANGNFSANNITASLNGTALNATNIEGGAAGSMPYQTANNTTGLLTAGTEGQYLQLTSGLPSWKTMSTSVNASNITGTIALINGGTGQTTTAGIQFALGLAGTRVAIGQAAGQTSQGFQSVAIGLSSGSTSQAAGAVSVGGGAGQTSQGTGAVALGASSGSTNQGVGAVAIGSNAGQTSQGAKSVAIGFAAGQTNQPANSVAIGASSAAHTNSAAIGFQAVTTAENTIQLGADGVTVTGSTAITNVKTSGTLTAGAVTYPNTLGTNGQLLISSGSGTLIWTSAYDTRITSATNSITSLSKNILASTISGTVAIANGGTGQTTITGIQTALGLAGTNVAIGAQAGTYSQSASSIAIGNFAGRNSQGTYSVALGTAAAQDAQGTNSVAIGNNAGTTTQGNQSVAIGNYAAQTNQGIRSVALGAYTVAGNVNSTAIGFGAKTSADNTIQLGADGSNSPLGLTTAITNVKTSGTLTAGAVTYPNTDGTSGQLLTTTGTGTLTWTSAYDTRITSATNSITSNTTSINVLNTNVASNTASITSNTSNITSNTSSITSNTTSIN